MGGAARGCGFEPPIFRYSVVADLFRGCSTRLSYPATAPLELQYLAPGFRLKYLSVVDSYGGHSVGAG